MIDIYHSLSAKEKSFLWVAATIVVVLLGVAIVNNAGIVAGAQVAAAIGTLALAVTAFAQVRELRETRIAQEQPQVIVDADYGRAPLVSVVVRNIGKGAARNISFSFSDPMPISWNQGDSQIPTLDKLPMFEEGIDFLAPGAEISTAWDSLISLNSLLRELGLESGLKITSRYESLAGDYYETLWTINPIRTASLSFGAEKGVEDIAKALKSIDKDFHRVVSRQNQEVRISTASEREQRRTQNDDEGS
ncbi:MAG: hypothetical protein ACFB50_10230 [Rubrobacteraceae bacterium]